MSTTLEFLEAEVLRLAPSERSRLLERLFVSLDEDVEVKVAWAREADERAAELDAGAVTAVSGDQMMERLRARLGRRTRFTLVPNAILPRPRIST